MKRLADKPFALLGVNSDANKDTLRPRLEEENISWRSFWNGPKGTQGPISAQWNVQSWPTIYILDHKGVIRFKNKRGEDMDQAVDQLLAEMEAEDR
ncbi:MAG: TlpA family protein disulfide reductase [Planctomycetota bacterium]